MSKTIEYKYVMNLPRQADYQYHECIQTVIDDLIANGHKLISVVPVQYDEGYLKNTMIISEVETP